jgi:hypothetical protein
MILRSKMLKNKKTSRGNAIVLKGSVKKQTGFSLIECHFIDLFFLPARGDIFADNFMMVGPRWNVKW